MPEYIECITKHRAKTFICALCNEHCWDDPCEPSDCEWMAAIESEPAADVVSRAAFDQVMWERDMAMEQLKEHGIPFGGKADVVAVVHGEWVITEEYNDVIEMDVVKYTCSVCGEYRLSGSGLNQATNYCPHCGARMDGE